MNKAWVFIFILFTYLNVAGKSASLSDSSYIDLILVGIDHPFHLKDNIILPRLADSLLNKSPYFRIADRFSTGEELIRKLTYYTKQYGSIRNLALIGHSGYEGFFVKNNSGFYRDEYESILKGQKIPLMKTARRVQDLRKVITMGNIVFHQTSIVILVGCNTAYSDDNIAYSIADVLNRPVIGSNQKVDLYNVKNFGEDMLGEEKKTFIAYIPLPEEMIRYDLSSSNLTISEAIRRVEQKITKEQ